MKWLLPACLLLLILVVLEVSYRISNKKDEQIRRLEGGEP